MEALADFLPPADSKSGRGEALRCLVGRLLSRRRPALLGSIQAKSKLWHGPFPALLLGWVMAEFALFSGRRSGFFHLGGETF
jgi:hypothetical protein